MKKLIILFAALTIAVYVVPAQTEDSYLSPNTNKKVVENNLFIGLSTENTGLQRSCALMLGRIKSDRAIIPLMEILHSNYDENVRIAAAWALCKIGNSQGVYAVKMAVKFDESSKVQATCAWYYENLVKRGTFIFSEPEPVMVATNNQ